MLPSGYPLVVRLMASCLCSGCGSRLRLCQGRATLSFLFSIFRTPTAHSLTTCLKAMITKMKVNNKDSGTASHSVTFSCQVISSCGVRTYISQCYAESHLTPVSYLYNVHAKYRAEKR